MEVLHHMWWLIREVVGVLKYAWPVSVTLVLLVALSVAAARSWRSSVFARAALRLLILAAAVVFTQIALTLVFARGSAKTFPPVTAWPGYLVIGVWCAHFVVGFVIVARAQQSRVSLATVMLTTLWLSVAALFVAFMSVSGAASL